jgi:hypothetical protein
MIFKYLLIYFLSVINPVFFWKNNKWFSLPAFDPSIKEAASLIDPKSFKHKSVSTVAYTGTKTKQTIKLADTRCYKSCSCSCYNFNK